MTHRCTKCGVPISSTWERWHDSAPYHILCAPVGATTYDDRETIDESGHTQPVRAPRAGRSEDSRHAPERSRDDRERNGDAQRTTDRGRVEDEGDGRARTRPTSREHVGRSRRSRVVADADFDERGRVVFFGNVKKLNESTEGARRGLMMLSGMALGISIGYSTAKFSPWSEIVTGALMLLVMLPAFRIIRRITKFDDEPVDAPVVGFDWSSMLSQTTTALRKGPHHD